MRILRRRLGVSQDELAFLIGYRDSHVSRLENGSRSPQLADVLAIELVFGLGIGIVFPHLRENLRHEVIVRVERLITSIGASRSTARKMYKVAQLERVLASLRAQTPTKRGTRNGDF